MALRKLSPAEATEVREEWIRAVESLMDQVRAWAEAQGWTVEAKRHCLREEALGGEYQVPGLEITTPRGRLELEPIARNVLGADGRVDFYVWPTLARVLLIRNTDSEWVIQTEFGPKWPHPWAPKTFVELAEALLDEQ